MNNDGQDYEHPKEYIVGLPKAKRELEFPDGTYILNSKNQVCIMTNGRPQFTKEDQNIIRKSKCSGKLNILLCPEEDCVWHSKSNQCRNRKNASKKVIEEDKIHRKLYLKNNTSGFEVQSIFNTKKQKSKVVRLLTLLVQGYSNEDDMTYAQHAIKKLNKLLSKLEDSETKYDLPSFSLSDYD